MKSGGVYLWILKNNNPPRVFYVGECGNYFVRFRDHFTFHMAGRYVFWDIDDGDDYIKLLADRIIKENAPDKIPFDLSKGKIFFPKVYPYSVANGLLKDVFTSEFLDKEYYDCRLKFLNNLSFAFGTFDANNQSKKEVAKMRRGIETALIDGVVNTYDSGGKLKTPRTTIVGMRSSRGKRKLDIKHDGESDKVLKEVTNVISCKW
ncbi:MAG: hypothetical protein OEZ55_01100 [Nitrospinota bacterium]|nr:hypothetical protein [Nitrospinota bacterium]